MRDVVVTRVRYSGPPRRSRNLQERLMVRFPTLYRRVAALALRRLSPRSRVRRAMLCRAQVSGWDAVARKDFEVLLVRYAPDVEVEFDPEFEALGLGGTFRGHDGWLKMVQAFDEAWERRERVPEFVVDLGDRALWLATMRLPGNVSGLELEREWAALATFRGGLVAHEQYFFGWDKGLRAAALDPDAIAHTTGCSTDMSGLPRSS
jgi:ketosteroid isomerase-like protein